MSKLTLIIFAICFVSLCAAEGSRQSSSVRNSFSKIVPRLLWNIRHGEDNNRNQQTPVIVVQSPQDSDRHHHQHYPYYPPYYQSYRPPPPPPPPFNFPGMEYLNNAGGGPTYLIINPNNIQGINLTTGGNSTRRSLSGPSIFDLLQGLNLSELADGFDDDSEVVNASDDGDLELGGNNHHQAHNNDDNQDQDDQDAISDDEFSVLERQANRGLSPKHLLSFLMQDKRRKRMQEVLAGIYLRNYNLNRK